MPHLRQRDDGTYEQVLAPGEEYRCDFCSSKPVEHSFGAQSHVSALVQTDDGVLSENSIDDWAACAECAALVRRTDRAGLVKRSEENFYRLNPDTPEEMREFLTEHFRTIHDNFWMWREPHRDRDIPESERRAP